MTWEKPRTRKPSLTGFPIPTANAPMPGGTSYTRSSSKKFPVREKGDYSRYSFFFLFNSIIKFWLLEEAHMKIKLNKWIGLKQPYFSCANCEKLDNSSENFSQILFFDDSTIAAICLACNMPTPGKVKDIYSIVN